MVQKPEPSKPFPHPREDDSVVRPRVGDPVIPRPFPASRPGMDLTLTDTRPEHWPAKGSIVYLWQTRAVLAPFWTPAHLVDVGEDGIASLRIEFDDTNPAIDSTHPERAKSEGLDVEGVPYGEKHGGEFVGGVRYPYWTEKKPVLPS